MFIYSTKPDFIALKKGQSEELLIILLDEEPGMLLYLYYLSIWHSLDFG